MFVGAPGRVPGDGGPRRLDARGRGRGGPPAARCAAGVGEIARKDTGDVVVAHAGDGNTHPIIGSTRPTRPSRTRARWPSRDHGPRVALGGTITGEHGVGRLKKELLPTQLGPRVTQLNQQVKQLFDPDNILNPGAILIEAAPGRQGRDLRARVVRRRSGGLRFPSFDGQYRLRGRPSPRKPPSDGKRSTHSPPDPRKPPSDGKRSTHSPPTHETRRLTENAAPTAPPTHETRRLTEGASTHAPYASRYVRLTTTVAAARSCNPRRS